MTTRIRSYILTTVAWPTSVGKLRMLLKTTVSWKTSVTQEIRDRAAQSHLTVPRSSSRRKALKSKEAIHGKVRRLISPSCTWPSKRFSEQTSWDVVHNEQMSWAWLLLDDGPEAVGVEALLFLLDVERPLCAAPDYVGWGRRGAILSVEAGVLV